MRIQELLEEPLALWKNAVAGYQGVKFKDRLSATGGNVDDTSSSYKSIELKSSDANILDKLIKGEDLESWEKSRIKKSIHGASPEDSNRQIIKKALYGRPLDSSETQQLEKLRDSL